MYAHLRACACLRACVVVVVVVCLLEMVPWAAMGKEESLVVVSKGRRLITG